jgi:hypothetical protein
MLGDFPANTSGHPDAEPVRCFWKQVNLPILTDWNVFRSFGSAWPRKNSIFYRQVFFFSKTIPKSFSVAFPQQISWNSFGLTKGQRPVFIRAWPQRWTLPPRENVHPFAHPQGWTLSTVYKNGWRTEGFYPQGLTSPRGQSLPKIHHISCYRDQWDRSLNLGYRVAQRVHTRNLGHHIPNVSLQHIVPSLSLPT